MPYILPFSLGIQPVVKSKIGSVATLGINRPEMRNCVNYGTAELLVNYLEEFENDESVTSIVLYGVGGNFCAGYDLQELSTADISILPKTRGPMVLILVKFNAIFTRQYFAWLRVLQEWQ